MAAVVVRDGRVLEAAVSTFSLRNLRESIEDQRLEAEHDEAPEYDERDEKPRRCPECGGAIGYHTSPLCPANDDEGPDDYCGEASQCE